ncbi:unnamed protein product [Cuscuta europaea]|uniref:Copia protein n=1 Tax=Cuscuta europaea TaxID=41803 RepID=A0A9P1A0Y5_CUSEU|nr:unnamed protein product [Cuscuta europaea]
MTSVTCEILWLKGLLQCLGISHSSPVSLYYDSQADDPVFYERTKHIEINCHFVRDEIVCHTIATVYTPTSLQLADILTKALGRRSFHFLLAKLSIRNLHAPT